MRAVRLGSYSMASTSASTPRFLRLKSMMRYFCLCPPPMWREVSRPWLFRPPVFLMVWTSFFSGFDLVISSNFGSALKRSTGVNGLNVLRAMALREFDLVAFLEGDNGLLPMRPAPIAARVALVALLLAGVVAGVDGSNRFLEKRLDGMLDLHLVGARAYPEDVLVVLLGEKRALLGEPRGLDEVERFVHAILSASCARPWSVMTTFLNASRCSVFTSRAVMRSAGWTLRVERYVFSSKASETTRTFSSGVCSFNNEINALVLASLTANPGTTRTSPALIRSVSAFLSARRRVVLPTFFE